MHDDHINMKRQALRVLGILQDERALLNDDDKHRLAGNLNVCYLGIEGKTIINSVSDQISISAGSACTTERGTLPRYNGT